MIGYRASSEVAVGALTGSRRRRPVTRSRLRHCLVSAAFTAESSATRPRQSRRRPVVTRVQLVSWLTSGHLPGNAAEEEVPPHLDLHYSVHTPSGGGTKQADEGLKRAVSQSLKS